MKLKQKKWKLYLKEATIFVSMFILTMLHEWVTITTLVGFLKGLAFFVIIYTQAQIHRFFIFPLFLKKHTIKYFTITLLSVLIGAAIVFATNYLYFYPKFWIKYSPLWAYCYYLVICIISTFTIMSLTLMQQHSLELQKRNNDQLLMNDMNLKYLHAQLNPHFFFNMLNNLYGVSLTEPERTPSLIIKLSDLMRYQIENVKGSTVKLSEEFSYIKNYIGLEKERVGKRCDIQLNMPIDNEQDDYQIRPLLLIILIENAFKHSVRSEYWFVHIDVKLENSMLKLQIQNSIPQESLKQKSTGIGISNIEQRLKLLYKDKFEFVREKDEFSYRTALSLKLRNDG